jgi:hypothetical protein
MLQIIVLVCAIGSKCDDHHFRSREVFQAPPGFAICLWQGTFTQNRASEPGQNEEQHVRCRQ